MVKRGIHQTVSRGILGGLLSTDLLDRKESNSLLRERKLLHPIDEIDLFSKIHNSLN